MALFFEKILVAVIGVVLFHYFYKYVVYKGYCSLIRGTDYTERALLQDKIFFGIEVLIEIAFVISTFINLE